MAFVDVTVPYASIQGGGASAQFGGAPTGGGSNRAGAMPVAMPSGSQGPGTNVAQRHWVIAFYVLIGAVLIWAGVIFNNKG